MTQEEVNEMFAKAGFPYPSFYRNFALFSESDSNYHPHREITIYLDGEVDIEDGDYYQSHSHTFSLTPVLLEAINAQVELFKNNEMCDS